jgi:hypothetical protein
MVYYSFPLIFEQRLDVALRETQFFKDVAQVFIRPRRKVAHTVAIKLRGYTQVFRGLFVGRQAHAVGVVTHNRPKRLPTLFRGRWF